MTFILQLYIFNIIQLYIYMVHAVFYVHVAVVLNFHVDDHHDVAHIVSHVRYVHLMFSLQIDVYM